MKNILVVDDNPQNLYLLQSLLGANGYEIATAANGAEALEKAHCKRPDMVVADILMPVMDGFELCRRWMRDDELKGVPFVFYTATYTDSKDEELALGLGAARFIVKPQEPEAFLKALNEVLAACETDRLPPPSPPPMEEEVYIREYNEALIRKLEAKMFQLEDANRCLEKEIAERKEAEADLRRLATAIEQTGEIVIITDAEGTIQYLNPAFETVTGYRREEALGRNPRLWKSGRHDPAFYRNLWGTISSGKSWSGRIVNKRKDGRLYTEEAAISPVVDASGRIVNYVAVKRDITAHLQLEAQFQQAMKMEAVGRLAGGVAHDLNNALTPLLGISGILLKKIRPGNALYDDVKEIQEAGQRCANLTRQLLAFSRSQALEPTILDLNGVVANMMKMLSRVIGEDIELVQRLDPELGRVKADAGQMEQILANLAVNARDAMPSGGRLTIETKNVNLEGSCFGGEDALAPGRYVMLAVSDNGAGMDPETRARIFEPFFTTKEKGKGTGLGLSTVYGIVKQSGGDIRVGSEPGKGTTMRIYLPRVQGEAGETEKRPPASAGPPRGSETILLVEDEECVRRVAGRMLSELGYSVLEAAGGAQALALCKGFDGPIQLVITDVVMPGMSGTEMAGRLSAFRPGTRVLFTSGFTDRPGTCPDVPEKGIDLLRKPFTLESLAAKVREALDRA